ncbi:alpha/beta fold hydrolase [Cognatishimia maritima]|uniref:Pimeloyl-ACP methyl ester carboxylesterase n=1 Tax=Cognatishimia maritima TaxID=870908 RepID=A0A1M5I7B2_9RHOB|nr:alpha/beta hydrolase [Cognatishimia maritima]SHG24122.1 Pimeloyl-ACP methyl ester carboxylesterase [Cognatishimia maritima]
MKLAAKLFILLLIVAVAFAVLTLWKARSNEARAEAAYPPEGQMLTVDGIAVHAVVRGAGPDLVLIHGASGSTRDFTFSLMDGLAQSYRVIAFDRPGLGYTDVIDTPTIDRQAALLQNAAAQLGAEKPIVLGQSYGGSVALAWAVNHPETLSALVALSTPSIPWTSDLSTFYKIMSHPVLGPLVAPVLTAWVSNERVTHEVESVFAPQSAPEGYAEHFGPGLTLRRQSLLANAQQRADLLGEIQALSKSYDAITVPTELVHGDADTTVGLEIHSRPLNEQLDIANLTVLRGIGHMPHHVAEDDIIAAVDRAARRAALH